jgi:hypothetical protein
MKTRVYVTTAPTAEEATALNSGCIGEADCVLEAHLLANGIHSIIDFEDGRSIGLRVHNALYPHPLTGVGTDVYILRTAGDAKNIPMVWPEDGDNIITDDKQRCACCNRVIKGTPKWWVEVTDGAATARHPGLPAWEHSGGYMGFYPVGPECRKKLGACVQSAADLDAKHA